MLVLQKMQVIYTMSLFFDAEHASDIMNMEQVFVLANCPPLGSSRATTCIIQRGTRNSDRSAS